MKKTSSHNGTMLADKQKVLETMKKLNSGNSVSGSVQSTPLKRANFDSTLEQRETISPVSPAKSDVNTMSPMKKSEIDRRFPITKVPSVIKESSNPIQEMRR